MMRSGIFVVPQTDRLRQLFSGADGWQPLHTGPGMLESAHWRYRILPLARHASEVTVLLCEPELGSPLPDYHARRRLHTRIEQLHPRPFAIFTDAAQTVQVWAWRSRTPGGALAYHERQLQPDDWPSVERQVRFAVADAVGVHEQGSELSGEHPAAEILPCFICSVSRLRPGAFLSGRAPSPALLQLDREARARGSKLPSRLPAATLQQTVQEFIEEIDDPDTLRACWRALQGITVLDPACGGDGSWLLAALETLEALHTACLNRMRSWLGDLPSRPSHPFRLSDFRALTDQAENSRSFATPQHFVREAILLHNLFGEDSDSEALATTRRRLLSRLENQREDPAEPSIWPEDNFRSGNPEYGFATRGEIAAALRGRPDAEVSLRKWTEEAETLERASLMLRQMRLQQGVHWRELHTSQERIRQRRMRLNRELDGIRAAAEGIDPGHERAIQDWRTLRQPLHRFVEYFGVSRRGGFGVVRGRSR